MLSRARLEDVKNVDVRTKDLVFGYIKRVQELLPGDNIPRLVTHWCLLYFYESELFDREKHGKLFEVNESRTTVNKTANGDASAFLTKVVDRGVHRWKFRIVSHTDMTCTINIGL